MNFNSISVSNSVKLPELKSSQKFLITELDDKGFAQDQADKISQNVYLQKQMKLKPWEKDSYKNIYSSSGKSNYQILQNLRKNRAHSPRTINISDVSSNKYYNDSELKSINESQKISKQILSNSEIRVKYKQPLTTNVKLYIDQTKETCKKKMLFDLIKIERDKMKVKQADYEKALRQEIRNLNYDIHQFEKYATNEMILNSQRNKELNEIKSNMKNLSEIYKKLSQEYHSTKNKIKKTLKKINDIKIYVTFVHKLFGGESELENCNLEEINFQNLTDKELHLISEMVDKEVNRKRPQENILITALNEEEFLEDNNSIDIIFAVIEENIIKSLDIKEKIRKENILLNENREAEKKELQKIIENREKEYKQVLEDYLIEKRNIDYLKHSSEDYNNYIKKLHMDLFECIKEGIINNKKDINEYNIVDKIVKPNLKEIKNKETKIDKLIIEMEKYSNENNELFSNSVIKIKNENKIRKYIEEKNNREMDNCLKNAKILEKMNKIIITGKNKYNMPAPLSLLKKRKDEKKEIKTEPSYLQLINY